MGKLRVERRYATTPNDILNNPELSLRAKGLWGYLQSKPTGWSFSVAKISAQCRESKNTISKVLKELEELGLLSRERKMTKSGSEMRYILTEPLTKTALMQKPYNANSTNATLVNIVNKNSSKKELSKKDKGTNVPLAKAEIEPKKSNPEIDQLFVYWQEQTSYQITSKVKANRYACSNLLKKFGIQGVEQLIRAVSATQSDQFAPRISDFTDLQAKLNQLLLWAKQKQDNTVQTVF